MEDIISKYLDNSATEEEKALLLQWLEEKGTNREQFKNMYDLWLYSSALLTPPEEEVALTHLKNSMLLHQKKATPLRVAGNYFIRIAASILLLLSAGYIGYMLKGHQEQAVVSMNKLLTGANGKGQYVLPDGSTVWLNANSVLEYPDTFTGGKREVRLKGEALFEVKKDKNKPFYVHAGGLDVKVLGTRFLVNNYPQKAIVETVLVNGSVEISGDYFTEPQVLLPKQLITYNKETMQKERSTVNTDDYTNWIHSKLVFDKTNLASVIINLEKWYGVKIVAPDELIRNTHLSFTVRQESLDEILKYMSLTAPITYKWEDDTLHIYSKKGRNKQRDNNLKNNTIM